MPALPQDLRYTLRQIHRSPGFFAIAVFLIAIGTAATTQIFTLVNAMLLTPLPVHNPQNLVQLFQQQAKRPADPLFDYRFYKQLAHHSSTLFNVAGQMDTTRALERNGHAERIHAVAVTENFFNDLGVTPLLGRVLGKADSHVAVLSYTYSPIHTGPEASDAIQTSSVKCALTGPSLHNHRCHPREIHRDHLRQQS